VRTFRDLVAWQRAVELAVQIYAATESMPQSEQFGLTNQIRRAAVSVASNIAEGHARQSRPDYLRFLRMARGSLAELSTQLEIAYRARLLGPDQQLSDLAGETGRVLQGLIKSLEHKRHEGGSNG
jgi:four helix bundle protein